MKRFDASVAVAVPLTHRVAPPPRRVRGSKSTRNESNENSEPKKKKKKKTIKSCEK